MKELDKSKADDNKVFQPNKYISIYCQLEEWKGADLEDYKEHASQVIKQFYEILL